MMYRRATTQDDFYLVQGPNFSAGFIVVKGKVSEPCAPILRWMLDKDIDFVVKYCEKKRWKIEKVRPFKSPNESGPSKKRGKVLSNKIS